MTKIFFAFLALVTLPMISCTPGNESARNKPVLPTSDESDMPWNRPTGPEGGGPLSMLDNS
ncbi:hypothetical protein JIN77_00510 [Verrucomicrobiaceae bacterium R5-34]|uniref:Lipoprotein n=1 Tax=Oceaniferula flava TaxID=2800421 RepID=A0AAE2SBW0_9BACT|nr:hypothetical protein [Oceaniferula flavus]MBK1829194.1 hypothetical protein [Verrucomicrobiaceae bacterium R5-34]MBK1853431.1 hypothetical protein [Oceaniferula flavus]MBM1134736.1 hypothetical protein [Oceaniferula flavus]